MWELLWELLINGLGYPFRWKLSGSKSKSRRKPSKGVKVVIKSTNGEKHGVLENHTDE